MSTIVKVTTVGSSVGIVLPREVLAKLHVEKGDSLYITETPDGVQLTPYNEEFARVMEAADKVMRKYRDTLRKLAE
jgi:putative addiction module antidote